MISKLALQVYEDGNCKTFTVKDISEYNQDITISCNELFITPPGFGESFVFPVKTDFHNVYNSNDFAYTNSACDEDLIELQDGIYQIRYHICPTDKVFVEYYHLRQCQTLNNYHEALCAVKLEACESTNKQKEQLEELTEIKQYLDAAKAYVEVCNVPKKGIELQNYAISKLDALNITCKTCK